MGVMGGERGWGRTGEDGEESEGMEGGKECNELI